MSAPNIQKLTRILADLGYTVANTARHPNSRGTNFFLIGGGVVSVYDRTGTVVVQNLPDSEARELKSEISLKRPSWILGAPPPGALFGTK